MDISVLRVLMHVLNVKQIIYLVFNLNVFFVTLDSH